MPYPCGNFGHPKRECRCPETAITKYRAKVSGPLLDRIDLHVEAPAVEFKDLADSTPAESSETIRDRVLAVREIQARRFGAAGKARTNARMSHRDIKKFCALSPDCAAALEHAMENLGFSARAYDRILKVARTIADLAGSDSITFDHLSEAISYRNLDRKLWA